MHFSALLASLALAPLASAHFQLLYPAARGYDEDTLATYPCGGQNTVQNSNRTLFSTSSSPIQLNMEHPEAKVEVLIAFGNNPTGDDFTRVLVPTVQEVGPRSFCLGDVVVGNSSLAQAGMNATILVMTNGDPSGGLYNCADVTFTAAALSTDMYNANCMNSTGVTVQTIANSATTNANGTTVGAAASSGASSASSGTASATSAAAGAATSAAKSAAADGKAASTIGVAAAVGFAAVVAALL